MSFTLIENGRVFAPEPRGVQSILLLDSKIVKIGGVDVGALRAAGLECEVIDASGCSITPGFIDPHEHVIGAGGENGFTSRMPEVSFEQLVCAGITTVVGLLGTDTTTRNLSCLHAKVSQLYLEGLTAYMYTGGFEIPVRTIMSRVMDDLVMIDKIIGVGEIAISDSRWVDPTLDELAHVVTESMLGGKMAGKAGVTHFHVGPSDKRLSLLHTLLDEYEIPPECIYATHITRSEALLADAISLAKRGAYVDMDTVEENLAECLERYRALGGPMDKLTVSSDAHTPGGSPAKFYGQFLSCVRDRRMPLEEVLPLFTSNTATVLKLDQQGKLEEGMNADVLVLNESTFEIEHMLASGRPLIKEGKRVAKSQQERQLEESKA